MDTRHIAISDYTYTLPDDKIARYPLPERDASKLLIYEAGEIKTDTYRNISHYLPEKSLLVFNNTRVIAARLRFQKESGGVIEIFCLEPGPACSDITTGMLQQGNVQWKCLIGGASKWKTGQVLQKKIVHAAGTIVLEARYHAKENDCFIINLQWTPPHLSFAEILQAAGIIPLPPYFKRAAETTDADRYQTLYARYDGSVAAPTAGLHFTQAVFEQLQQKDIAPIFVTLHVGAATFRPVKSDTMEGHEMHAEFIDVAAETIVALCGSQQTYAVGTTSARTLESLYWMGVKTMADPLIRQDQLWLQQWEVYEALQRYTVPAFDALESLLKWMNSHHLQRLISKTQLLIAPGYRFRMIRGLITNFHQPQSTLLLLVAAMTGNNWKNIYAYALENDFRFLSYGDGCLITLPEDMKG